MCSVSRPVGNVGLRLVDELYVGAFRTTAGAHHEDRAELLPLRLLRHIPENRALPLPGDAACHGHRWKPGLLPREPKTAAVRRNVHVLRIGDGVLVLGKFHIVQRQRHVPNVSLMWESRVRRRETMSIAVNLRMFPEQDASACRLVDDLPRSAQGRLARDSLRGCSRGNGSHGKRLRQ